MLMIGEASMPEDSGIGQEVPESSFQSPTASQQMRPSLLAQALEVPSLDHQPGSMDGESISRSSSNSAAASSTLAVMSNPLLHETTPKTSNGSITAAISSPWMIPTHRGLNDDGEDDFSDEDAILMIPRHSDFTIPTSNALMMGSQQQQQHSRGQPPPDEIPNRRSVFGNSVGRRYQVPPITNGKSSSSSHTSLTPPSSLHIPDPPVISPPPPVTYMIHKVEQEPGSISPLTPARTLGGTVLEDDEDEEEAMGVIGPLPPPHHTSLLRHARRTKTTFHETIHAQSLLLGLAFVAIWSPNNAMAPNLTQMADFFGMSEGERDLYLGSYCALALGVFSLPLSALLGFMTDFYSRKHLFVCCALGGALASAWTGWSKTFASLFAARLMSGGCMSGSVPVAFSLLGDLFSTEERNAASSGLTAMMGLGILLGQVYAGTIGPKKSWQFPFFASSFLSLTMALLVLLWVREPIRGGKEKALQGLLHSGNKYERQLTLKGFLDAMQKNRSNTLLLWQGFFTSLPWGIVFVFLNDFLSQEKGFSVPDATFMVMLFGVGCAIGGICGGYIGQVCQKHNRHLLPLFMAVATFCGILPFLGLLNSEFANKHGYKAMGYSILGGCIASLPSVNVRPCILNVNPPETRGAALTAANLLVAIGRGIGPCCITLMGTIFSISRKSAFNFTLSLFWTVTAILLLFLVKTLPEDQDLMEEGLARYAEELSKQRSEFELIHGSTANQGHDGVETTITDERLEIARLKFDDSESIVSIEDYMTSFDGTAARRSFDFMRQGLRELSDEVATFGHGCRPCDGSGEMFDQDRADDAVLEEILPQEELQRRRKLWKQQQERQRRQTRSGGLIDINEKEESPNSLVNESTPLL